MRCKGQEPNCSVFTSDDLMLATIMWHRSLSGSQGFLHRYVVKMCLQSLRPPPPFSGAWGRCTSTKILQDVAFLAAQRSLHFRSAYGTFWHAYLASEWFHHLHFHTKTSNAFCCTFCSELPQKTWISKRLKGPFAPLLGKFDIKNQGKALAFHPADPPAAPVDACTFKMTIFSYLSYFQGTICHPHELSFWNFLPKAKRLQPMVTHGIHKLSASFLRHHRASQSTISEEQSSGVMCLSVGTAWKRNVTCRGHSLKTHLQRDLRKDYTNCLLKPSYHYDHRFFG